MDAGGFWRGMQIESLPETAGASGTVLGAERVLVNSTRDREQECWPGQQPIRRRKQPLTLYKSIGVRLGEPVPSDEDET